jgi:hypothetical protein
MAARLASLEGFDPSTPGLRSPRAVRPTPNAVCRICGKGQMALCEDKSCGLTRAASDDRIVRRLVARRQAIGCPETRFRFPEFSRHLV